MQKYKTKFIAAAAIIAMLAAAWFYGGASAAYVPSADAAFPPFMSIDGNANNNFSYVEYAPSFFSTPNGVAGQTRNDEHTEKSEQDTVDDSKSAKVSIVKETADTEIQDTQIFGEEHPEAREPAEPEDMLIGDGSFTVTLTIRADMILHNMHLLDSEKHELVPLDGVIFHSEQVTAYEGESVFNVLQRETRRNGIHMVSRWTPVFNSAYVEAINNLYEFDAGPLSGWMYSVNGWFPNFGSSRYLLSPDDVIKWVYTVDLGRDLGVHWVEGGQLQHE